MHQCFGLSGVRVLGSQLGEFDAQAGMLRDMDVGWKVGSHGCGIWLRDPRRMVSRVCRYLKVHVIARLDGTFHGASVGTEYPGALSDAKTHLTLGQFIAVFHACVFQL